MQRGMAAMEMGPEATVDTQKLVAASGGSFPEHRPEDIKSTHCKCTGPDCLTLSCPCFSAAFLCSETCNCQVCGNAPDIKPGIEMTLEEIDSKYPHPDFLKDVVCTCEKDGCTKLCTGCSISCQYYASLNQFEKKKIYVDSPIKSANSSLTFDSTVDGTDQRLSIVKQQIESAIPYALDQSVKTLPELSQLPLQQQITTYTSPWTCSPSMMGNASFPQCSNQQLNPAHPLPINQTVQRMPEFYQIPEQQKINSVFPRSFAQRMEPANSLAFNQTVPNMRGLHHFARQQNITSTSAATFNPPTTSHRDHFDAKSHYEELCRRKKSNATSSSYSDAKSYYEELCPTKKLSYRDYKQDAMMMVMRKKTTSKNCIPLNTKKPSKVSLNGCLCQMFSCAQRNCKCLRYGVGCSDHCKCNNCQNPHGSRNAMQ